MDILSNFGIETKLFLAQVVNFLVLALIIRLFLYKPIKKVMGERRDKIQKGLADSEEAHRLVAATARERDEVLKKARVEMEQIVDSGRQAAEEVREKALAETRAQADIIVAQARVQAQEEMAKMERQVQAMSVDISKRIMERVIPQLFTQAEKDALLERALKRVEEDHGGNGNA